MKIVKPTKNSPQFEIYFSDDFFLTFINEWKQLRGKWNWYSFTFINIYLENDKCTDGVEFDFILLGLGVHLRYNYDFENSEVGKIIKEYERENK